jgi:hypothetical protein
VANTFFDNGWLQNTINIWVKVNSVNPSNTMINTNPHCGIAIGYSYLGNEKFYHYRGPDPVNNTLPCWSVFNQDLFNYNASPVNQWILLTIVKSANEYSYYINGIWDKTTSSSVVTLPGYCAMIFGAINNGTEGLNGKLDDIAIYNRALTQEEITALYTGSSSNNGGGGGGTVGTPAASVPAGIPYQAVIRDNAGLPLVNAPVTVRFTLHQNTTDGTVEYQEAHALTTNAFGLVNTLFGNGTASQGSFANINWSATTKFVQVEANSGAGYVDMGTQQMMSVPFAMKANQANEAGKVKNASLPVFANNAAALAGGLLPGEMYRTAAGILMIVY